MTDPSSVGPTLRRLRTERSIALAAVAEQAGISIATLSRIETNKQSIDVGLLLTLSQILGVSPADILGGDDEPDDVGALSRRLAALPAADRVKVFRNVVPPRTAKELQPALDGLIATVDLIREELLSVQRAVRRRGKQWRRSGQGFPAGLFDRVQLAFRRCRHDDHAGGAGVVHAWRGM